MSDKIKTTIFDEKILNTYIIKAISEEEYWQFYNEQFFTHDLSNQGIFFDSRALTSRENLEKLKKIEKKYTHESDNLLIIDEMHNLVIAIFRGYQKDFDTYYIHHIVVHPDYRRMGIYSELMSKILRYTKETGYNKITSSHAPNNNAILIAHLKLGFYISTFEIDPEWGININTVYFHNAELKRAFDIRCGGMSMSKELAASAPINKYNAWIFDMLNKK